MDNQIPLASLPFLKKSGLVIFDKPADLDFLFLLLESALFWLQRAIYPPQPDVLRYGETVSFFSHNNKN
jgi:hypothetical protein